MLPDYTTGWKTISQPVAESIGQACLAIAFPIMVFGLIVRLRQHKDDINGQLGIIASAGMIVALFYGYPYIIRTLNDSMKSFGNAQSQIVKKALKNAADKILLPTEDEKAIAYSEDQLNSSPIWNMWNEFWKDAKKSKFGLTAITDSISVAMKYCLWRIGSLVHMAMDFIQEYLINIFICLSPIPLGMLLLPYTESIGIKFFSCSLGLVLWRLGYVFADLITLEVGDWILTGMGAFLVGDVAGLTLTALATGGSVWVASVQAVIAIFTTLALLICILHIGIPIAIVKIISGGDPVGSLMGAVGIGQRAMMMGRMGGGIHLSNVGNGNSLNMNASAQLAFQGQGSLANTATHNHNRSANESTGSDGNSTGNEEGGSAPQLLSGEHETAYTAQADYGSYTSRPINGHPASQYDSGGRQQQLLTSAYPQLSFSDYPSSAQLSGGGQQMLPGSNSSQSQLNQASQVPLLSSAGGGYSLPGPNYHKSLPGGRASAQQNVPEGNNQKRHQSTTETIDIEAEDVND